MSDWYYGENDEQKGPINEAELKEKLAAKQLPADTLVWQKGMSDWVAANSLPNFQFTPPPAPADTPPTLPASPDKPAEKPAEPFTPASTAGGVSDPTPAPAATKQAAAPAEEEDDDDDYAELGEIIKRPPELEVDKADFEKNKILGIMSYVYVLFLVPLLFAPKSPFARYHGAQGLTLFFITTLYWLFIVSLWFVLQNQIPDVIFYLIMFAPPITLAVIGIMNASKGKASPLPIIGGFTLLR